MNIISTNKGKIKGVKNEGYTFFGGIPYAKAPIGELRWKAPKESDAWEDTLDATKFSPCCLQYPPHTEFYRKEFEPDIMHTVSQSEDCLYLNIWVPDGEIVEPLPVAFWIHGGAFLGGHGSEIEFDGKEYCKRGVILVTINYRLGIFGFLALEELSRENERGISGNYGVLDQIAALRWVYDNISAFHGDPDRITIFGQSAGAMSVQTLVSTELTENMIHQGIMQSGGGYATGLSRGMYAEEAMEVGKKVLEIAGINSIEEFRTFTAEEVKEVGMKTMAALRAEKGLIFVPNIDGYLLNAGYDSLVEKGKVKKIAYLMGSTKDDMLTEINKETGEKQSPIHQGCIGWAMQLESYSHEPVFVYSFQRDLPGDDAGAFHSSELWYMFGTMKKCWRPWEERDFKLSEQMLDYWSQFIKFGHPTPGNTSDWPKYDSVLKYVKQLG